LLAAKQGRISVFPGGLRSAAWAAIRWMLLGGTSPRIAAAAGLKVRAESVTAKIISSGLGVAFRSDGSDIMTPRGLS
jgi:hypothetical protein